jgi:lysozyme family protein
VSAATWPQALAAVLRHEGGWSDHPRDPGGATMKGITLATFRAARGAERTKAELRAISDADVEDIYRQRYWLAVRGDDLPAGVDHAVFDAAVNSGPGRAARWLQQALGVWPDGAIGPKTLLAAAGRDPVELVDRICDLRLGYLKALQTFDVFGMGWTKRVAAVRSEAKSFAT